MRKKKNYLNCLWVFAEDEEEEEGERNRFSISVLKKYIYMSVVRT